VGLDYNAVALIADSHGVELVPSAWQKIKALEVRELNRQRKKN